MRFLRLGFTALLFGSCAFACTPAPESTADDTSELTVDPGANPANVDAIEYRDLATHPGCTTAGLESRSAGCAAFSHAGTGSYDSEQIASIPGYRCAAKTYPVTTAEADKPILLLVHGNSDVPNVFESNGGYPMLAERASEAGFLVFAVDLRFDRVDDPRGNNTTENAAQNFDHAWATPIAEHFIDSVMTAYPDRPISIVGFDTGATAVRDALRRLHRAHKKPFERLWDVVLAGGANHGMTEGTKLCRVNPTMRGKIGCQVGDRGAFHPTPFLASLNGPNGEFETPCADGLTAFGQSRVCARHIVRYTTLVMKDAVDPATGTPREEFVSEASAALRGATNLTIESSSPDTSLYFCSGIFRNHYGSVRSLEAMGAIMKVLTAP